ncbi:hypothetical protein TWF696_006807 [Orbilia brochopaga]|uniref:Uncharacterized protein n=1 Tax=Orbilia brochopaga TaxID=3140254 RepID=A0AAV9UR31_9PEZI
MASVQFTTNDGSQQGDSVPEAGTSSSPTVQATRHIPQQLDYSMRNWLASTAKADHWTPLRIQSEQNPST